MWNHLYSGWNKTLDQKSKFVEHYITFSEHLFRDKLDRKSEKIRPLTRAIRYFFLSHTPTKFSMRDADDLESVTNFSILENLVVY